MIGGFNTDVGRSSSIPGGELNNIAAVNSSDPIFSIFNGVLRATFDGGGQNGISGEGFQAVIGAGGFNHANASHANIGGGTRNTNSGPMRRYPKVRAIWRREILRSPREVFSKPPSQFPLSGRRDDCDVFVQ